MLVPSGWVNPLFRSIMMTPSELAEFDIFTFTMICFYCYFDDTKIGGYRLSEIAIFLLFAIFLCLFFKLIVYFYIVNC